MWFGGYARGQTDRQTHTDLLVTILCHAPAGAVNIHILYRVERLYIFYI